MIGEFGFGKMMFVKVIVGFVLVIGGEILFDGVLFVCDIGKCMKE